MIKQQDSYAIEPQFLCDVCSEAVTNPICPFCLATEIEAWMTLYPNLRHDLTPYLNKYLKQIGSRITEYTQCIKCGNKRAAVCPYCFTEYVLRSLKKIKVNKIILREFLDFFNFDLEHTGYSHEAEKLGVI